VNALSAASQRALADGIVADTRGQLEEQAAIEARFEQSAREAIELRLRGRHSEANAAARKARELMPRAIELETQTGTAASQRQGD
jgi:hypothetical protein